MKDALFTLVVERTIFIQAFERHETGQSHTRLDIEVRQGGKTIFPRGSLYVGIPGHKPIDGKYAKECVLSAVSMKPGDTDREYFDNYTAEQLEWVKEYGEMLSYEALRRYNQC